jgi:hypothetical protein
MLHMLDELERQIRPVVAHARFVLAHDGMGSVTGGDGMLLLEYRGGPLGRRCLRLDFCQLTKSQTITAELWSPADLASMAANATVEDVAIRRRVWRYKESDSPESVARQIVGEVSAWLESNSHR